MNEAAQLLAAAQAFAAARRAKDTKDTPQKPNVGQSEKKVADPSSSSKKTPPTAATATASAQRSDDGGEETGLAGLATRQQLSWRRGE